MRRPKTEVNAFIDRLIGRDGEPDGNFLTVFQLRGELAQKIENLRTVLEECRREEGKICADVELRLPTELSLLFRSLRDRGAISDPSVVQREVLRTREFSILLLPLIWQTCSVTKSSCAFRFSAVLGNLTLTILPLETP